MRLMVGCSRIFDNMPFHHLRRCVGLPEGPQRVRFGQVDQVARAVLGQSPAYVCKAEPVTPPHEMSSWVNMPGGRIL